jgi:hypothetical protein
LKVNGFGCEGPILSVLTGQELILSSYECDNLSKGEGILSEISGMEEKLGELVGLLRKSAICYGELNIKRPCLSSLIGEVLVLHELLKRGFKAVWKGRCGFGSYDVMINDGKRVEVKSATYNEEYGHWGFGKISPERFDYLVCVALNDGFSNPRYVIFTGEEAAALPTEEEAHRGGTTRFDGTEEKTFHLFNKEDEQRQPSETLRKINENIKNYEGRWDKIRGTH